MNQPGATDPLSDPDVRRQIVGNPWLALSGSLGGAVLGALIGAVVIYFTRGMGCWLVGVEGIVAGCFVGYPASRLGKGSHVWLRWLAAAMAVCSALAAVLLWLPVGTGKSYAVLFSLQPFGPGTERDATFNTLLNLAQGVSYLIAAAVAFYLAGQRPALPDRGPIPRCLQCSYDLRSVLATKNEYCPRCGTKIPDQYRGPR